MLTRMNAKSVPMLTRSARVVRSTKPAMAATTTPVIRVIRYGVPKVGCTLAIARGSSPSRPIANPTRHWPSIRIIATTTRPMQAPTEMRSPIQSTPAAENAVASGAASSGSMSR